MELDNKCELNNKTLWYVLHAESNAIVKVAKSTQSSEGSVLYTTLSPCDECSKLIMQAGIKRVVFSEMYSGSKNGLNMLIRNNIDVLQIDMVILGLVDKQKELDDNFMEQMEASKEVPVLNNEDNDDDTNQLVVMIKSIKGILKNALANEDYELASQMNEVLQQAKENLYDD